MWFNDTEVVLNHMGCPKWLWVRVASGAIHGVGRIWWQLVCLGDRLVEQIS